jgi:hypothetical protein
MKHFILGALAASALAVVSFASPASAQATRTWVSGLGDDANPCSRTAPCKTFAGAYSKTATWGEINVIDPGGFGAVTIGKSLTIRSDSVEAGVLVSGTNGIIVNLPAATDRVELNGLDFEGLNASTTSLNGVQIIGTGVTHINNCRINGFHNGNGVNLVGTANAQVIITDSKITNNLGGVNVQGAGSPSVANFASLFNSLVDSNTSFAVQVNGAADSIGIARSYLTGSGTGLSLLSGGVAVSFGPSNVVGGTGAFTSTVPYK